MNLLRVSTVKGLVQGLSKAVRATASIDWLGCIEDAMVPSSRGEQTDKILVMLLKQLFP